MSQTTGVVTPSQCRSLGGPVALAACHLQKSFGATRALTDCSFELATGEVHAVMGENGSGKSTLVKVISGVHQPDGGELLLEGKPAIGLVSPRAAHTRGIVTVFQEVLTIGARSVLDNVWIGSEGLLRSAMSRDTRRAMARERLGELLSVAPDLDQPVEELSLSERQACCIARALVREPRILLLDESTSALDIDTRDRLFAVLHDRAADGMSTIFISHRMDEVQTIADRVTVMRSGATVAAGLHREESSPEALVALMTGAERLTGARVRRPSAKVTVASPVMQIRGLRLSENAAAIDADIHPGEIVGLAGLEGHGQEAFLLALAGAASSGGVSVIGDNGPAMFGSPWQAARHGVAYVPRERREEALFPGMSVRENFRIQTMRHDRRFGVLRGSLSARRLAGYRDRLRITFGDQRQPVETLSGGNQQKVIIARLLATEPRVLLLNDPTRGIDLGAKRDVYELLAELAAQGTTVVMLSSEVDEHVELMDRVLVFREHALFCELGRDQLDRQALIASFFGHASDGRDV